MSFIENKLKSVYHRIGNATSVDQDGLPFFRIFFGFFHLLFAPYFGWIAEVPGSFFSPPIWSMANFFTRFPPGWLFSAIDTVLIILLLFITVGIKTRLSAILVFVILIFAQSFHYSLGKIDHGILYTLGFLILAFTNSGTKHALVKDRVISSDYQRFGLSLYGIFICFGFFTAGFPKLISWVDFDLSTNGILHWYYGGFYTLERQQFLAPFVPYIPMVLMEAGDYTAVLLELSGFVFLLKGKRHWKLWLIVLCVFHLMNILILNIPFLGHVVVYGLFLLPSFFSQVVRLREIKTTFYGMIICSGACLAGFRLFERFGNQPPDFFIDESVFAMVLWTFLAGVGVLTSFYADRHSNKDVPKPNRLPV